MFLYEINSWVVTGSMFKVIEGFYHWADRWIVGMMAQRMMSVEWYWPSVADVLETAGI